MAIGPAGLALRVQQNHKSDPSSDESRNDPRLARNSEKWETCKEEIRQTYLIEQQTLSATMMRIKETHGFTAS